jgi:hypothetical protein
MIAKVALSKPLNRLENPLCRIETAAGEQVNGDAGRRCDGGAIGTSRPFC